MQHQPLRILFFCLFACLVFSGCKKDDEMPSEGPLSNNAGVCDVEIDHFLLNDENIELAAYQSYSNVAFINSEGLEQIFEIGNSTILTDEGVFIDDDIRYCYSQQSVETTIQNDDGLQFTIIVETKPYFPDLTSSLEADVLKIFYNDTKNPSTDRRLVFRKVLDIKDYPSGLYETTVQIDSKYFIDAEFKDIEITNFNSPIITLYYSSEIGIVGYQDENEMMWQFNSKN